MSDLNEARKLIDAGQLEEARDVLVDILYDNYDNVEAWLLLTHCPQDHEEYARAIREVLRIDPENVEARRLAVELARDATRQAAAAPKSRQQQRRQRRTLQRTVRTFSNLVILVIVLGIGAIIALLLTATQDDDDSNRQINVPTVDPIVACTEQIDSTLNRLQARCGFLNRHEVCLGNPKVDFTGTTGKFTLQFPGDRTTTQQITALGTERFDNLNWGLVVISAQASLPDEGDTHMLVVVTSGVRLQNVDSRMERISFSSNPVVSSCPALPPSGILVSVPNDEIANFEVNGAIIELQGVVFFQVDAAAGLRVTALQGRIRVEHDNFERIAEAGEWFSWTVDPTLIVRDAPGDIMRTPDQLRGDIRQLVGLGSALNLPVDRWILPGMDSAAVILPKPSEQPEIAMTEDLNGEDISSPTTSWTATRTPTPLPPDLITPSDTGAGVVETAEAQEPTSRTVATRSTEPTTSPLDRPLTLTSVPSSPTTQPTSPQATLVAEVNPSLPDIAIQGSAWRCSVILGDITFRYLITLEPSETSEVLASGQLPNFGNTIVALDGEWILDPSQLTQEWTQIPAIDTTTAQAWLLLEETAILFDTGDDNYGIGGILRLALTQDNSMSGGIFASDQLVGFINRCELQ